MLPGPPNPDFPGSSDRNLPEVPEMLTAASLVTEKIRNGPAPSTGGLARQSLSVSPGGRGGQRGHAAADRGQRPRCHRVGGNRP